MRLAGVTTRSALLGIALLAAGLVVFGPADAAPRHRHHLFPLKKDHPAARVVREPIGATDPDKDAALILDGATG